MTIEWPEVTIGIITFSRPNEIVETVETLRDNLRYPEDKLHWLISDDASPGGYLAKLKKIKLFKEINAEFIDTGINSGWGANANNLLAHVTTPYLLQTEDDKRLWKPLDLMVGVALLETKLDIGYVRYRATAGEHTVFHQMETDITAYLPDYQDGAVGLPGKLSYLQIDSNSPSLYLYTHGPHLKHRRFHDWYGKYPEGLKLAATEESYCHTVKAKMKEYGAPALTILPEWILPYFEDYGQSFQGSTWDK